MKKVSILLATILVSVSVALTYHYFESAVHHSINFVWDTWLGTGTVRWLVIPACLFIGLVYFGVQHYLDQKSEVHESHGLGEAPAPTLVNFSKVLFIGFFSLLAGASLGPEAILVPACIIIGGYIGVKLFRGDSQIAKLLAMVGFIALFAAFFNSFIAGMLGLLLVKKQMKITLNAGLVLLAAIASAIVVLILSFYTSPEYLALPAHTWAFKLIDILAIIALAIAGYGVAYAIGFSHDKIEIVHKLVRKSDWRVRGVAAAAGLSIIYLLGGSLVEFTGNQSIQPMLQKAPALGFIGLVWICIIKIIAIGWSKSMGYRGGLVFPTIFVAAVLVAIAQIFAKDINFTYGIVAVMIGAIAANEKVKILF